MGHTMAIFLADVPPQGWILWMILRSSFWWVACLWDVAIGAASCHWSFCLQTWIFFGHTSRSKISHLQVQHVGLQGCFIGFLWSTLPETNSSPLKIDDWKTILSFWVWAYFHGRTVSFGEGRSKIWEWSLWDYFPFANDIFLGPERVLVTVAGC